MTRSKWSALGSVVLAVAYGASPIDLLPDIIPLLGLVDDALIVPMLLLVALFQWRRRSQKPRDLTPRIIPPAPSR